MKAWRTALPVCALCLLALGAAQPQAQKMQRIEIEATGPVEIDFEKGVAHAEKDARLTTRDGTFAADSMDFTFDQASAIVSLSAAGHVRIKVKTLTKDKVERQIDASADAATYEQKDRLLTLKGNVKGKIVEPARRRTYDLTSREATVQLDGDRMHFVGPKITITQPEAAPEPAPEKP